MRLLYTGMGLIVIMTAMAADRVKLKDGRVIAGTYLGGSSREVRIEAGDKIQSFNVADIDSIDFGGSLQGSVAAPLSTQPGDVLPAGAKLVETEKSPAAVG